LILRKKRAFGRKVEESCGVTGGTRENIKAIREIELEAHRETTLIERFGASVVSIVTHPASILLHGLGFFSWITANERLWFWGTSVDPFPFPMLGLAMTFEAIVLAIVILLNQKRQTRVEDHFEHLNLQITMLAEQETTKILQSLARICEHLDIANSAADDSEVRDMIGKTPVAALAKELKKSTTAASSDVDSLDSAT